MKLFFGQIFPEIIIDRDEQNHILKVLRMREGEEISVTDGNGNLATGTLAFEGKKVSLELSRLEKNLPGLARKLHIAIAPTKNIDRIEFFVEKATEMGISQITFLSTDNSERRNINLEKIRKQVVAASKQSLRFHFPVVNDLVKFQDFVNDLTPHNTFVCHCHNALERCELKSESVQEAKQKITFMIGPEGDFSDKEIQILAKKGIRGVSLGNQRLRTETAGILVAAWNYL